MTTQVGGREARGSRPAERGADENTRIRLDKGRTGERRGSPEASAGEQGSAGEAEGGYEERSYTVGLTARFGAVRDEPVHDLYFLKNKVSYYITDCGHEDNTLNKESPIRFCQINESLLLLK